MVLRCRVPGCQGARVPGCWCQVPVLSAEARGRCTWPWHPTSWHLVTAVTGSQVAIILRCASRIGADHAGFALKEHLVDDAEASRPPGRRSRHDQRRACRLSADLRRRRSRRCGGPRRSRDRHRRQRPGRADRRQQGAPACARRCATTCTPRACRGSTTTPTFSPWAAASSPSGSPTRSSSSGSNTPFEGGRHQRRIDRLPNRTTAAGPGNAGADHPPAAEHTRVSMATNTESRSAGVRSRKPIPRLRGTIAQEAHRQNSGLELIASENFVSQAVLEAAGSVLTNKYAEGYPGQALLRRLRVRGRRRVAARSSRAKELFGAEHANVQPHSGAQANMAVYFTLLKPGDTVLGMNLAHGGHLTHGHPLNFSGKLYTIVPYGVRKDDERIDYDEFERLAARAQAEDDHGRRQRLPAGHRLRAHRPRRPRRSGRRSSPTWRTSPAWSPPACTRARCRTPIS